MGNKDAINDFIYGLDYSEEEVLAFNGNVIENYVPKSGKSKDGEYAVITRTKSTIDSSFDITVSADNMSSTYLGNLLVVDSNLSKGTPTSLSTYRKPLNIMMNLPGMTHDNNITVANVSYANVTGAMNDILNEWYEKYPDYSTIPSDMSFVGDMVYDKKQLQLRFGCDVGVVEDKLGVDFEAIAKGEKSVYLARYVQVFYTASIEPFKEPAEPFAANVTVEELKKKRISDENPPAYVAAVSFGRDIYIKFEGNCTALQLQNKLSGKVSINGLTPGASGGLDVDDERITINCSMVVLGGTPKAVNGLFTNEDCIKEINELIFSNVMLTKDNPAYPLSYKVLFLKDNKLAQFRGTSEYITEKVEIFRDGMLILKHAGGYVAQFFISWDEITGYDEVGNEIRKHVNWSGNDDDKTAPYNSQIALSGNVRNINVKVQGCTGLAWDWWRTILDRKNMALVPERTVNIWGTSLNQVGVIEPEE